VTAPDTFAAPSIIRVADGLANAWPSWSPDSKWIAFGRGTNSRGRNDSMSLVFPGSLQIIPRAGGTAVRLDKANGGVTEDSYLPNFSPFDEGGYYWLAFYTTRDYGNVQAGTKGTGRRQIWVTAVSNSFDGTTDPSNVAYWLPDQDNQTDNMSGYWAPAPPVN